jgi:hypothetical protein
LKKKAKNSDASNVGVSKCDCRCSAQSNPANE